ncbi:MAG: hypothetical protein LUF33_01800 [Clostridiales bacterium]|nr:hypothetical protein [Clostridiales bacterium]
MRKISITLCLIFICLTVCGCSSRDESAILSSSDTTASAEAAAETVTEEATAAPAEEITVDETEYTAESLISKSLTEIIEIMGNDFEVEYSSERVIYYTGAVLYMYNDETLPGFVSFIDDVFSDYNQIFESEGKDRALEEIKENLLNGAYDNFTFMAAYSPAKYNDTISADMDYDEVQSELDNNNRLFNAGAGYVTQDINETATIYYDYFDEQYAYDVGDYLPAEVMENANPNIKAIVVFP